MLYFIIDGYNLIKRNPKEFSRPSLQGQRESALIFIRRYADLRKERFIVVFDGKKGIAFPVPAGEEIKVLFPQVETADDYIKRIISRHSHPNQLAVVSDDREIIEFARRRKTKVLSTKEFIQNRRRKKGRERLPGLGPAEAGRITSELRRALEKRYSKREE